MVSTAFVIMCKYAENTCVLWQTYPTIFFASRGKLVFLQKKTYKVYFSQKKLPTTNVFMFSTTLKLQYPEARIKTQTLPFCIQILCKREQEKQTILKSRTEIYMEKIFRNCIIIRIYFKLLLLTLKRAKTFPVCQM